MKGAPWLPADDERLRKLVKEGRNSVTIAERLKRTPNAIFARAHKLKITIIKRAKAKANQGLEVDPRSQGPSLIIGVLIILIWVVLQIRQSA